MPKRLFQRELSNISLSPSTIRLKWPKWSRKFLQVTLATQFLPDMANKIPTAGELDLSPETQKTLSERPLEENVPLESKNKMFFILGATFTVFVILSTAGVLSSGTF